jgi:type I pantothenate kinase
MSADSGAAVAQRPAEMPDGDLSPYRIFTRDEWAKLRADTPMTLTAEEVMRLQSLDDPVGLEEVVAIYLPLSRLLSLYVAATQGLFRATQRFLLAEKEAKVPYIIGVAGSVAVGKSTTARLLKALLARWPNTPKVDLVTTDGFLLPNADLSRLGLMERKGFPESYDTGKLLRFLADIKAGKRKVRAPLYSHLVYDVIPGEETVVDMPDILILEGLNVLQPARLPRDGTGIPFVSDYFDFSVYLDADENDLHRWYVSRFLKLRQTAFRDPLSYFRKYAELSEEEAIETADGLWTRINLLNLRENIVPTRQRASLILRKGPSHRIEQAALRRL